MLSLLKPKVAAATIPAQQIVPTYKRYRMQALLSVFLGYLAYYIVRNNFTLSTPYLKEQLDLSATQIGMLSSCMLIAYGISKGVMSSLADKASPKVFMACGLVMCAAVNVGLGFSSAFWIFVALVVINGLFQGMGVGPSFITIANWFPRRERGRVGAFWNISHNVGGGIVAPIVGTAFALLGAEHWQTASYIVPAAVAVLFAVVVLILGKGSPRSGAAGARRNAPGRESAAQYRQSGKSPGKHERMANLLYLRAEKQECLVRVDGRRVRLHGALRNDQLAAYLSSVGEALLERRDERRVSVFRMGGHSVDAAGRLAVG